VEIEQDQMVLAHEPDEDSATAVDTIALAMQKGCNVVDGDSEEVLAADTDMDAVMDMDIVGERTHTMEKIQNNTLLYLTQDKTMKKAF
jgi:hypothetical protein